MKKKFTSVSTQGTSQKPSYKKTILDDIIPCSKEDFFSSIAENEENLKRQTFLLKEETIEKIKDFVYTQKINGDLMYTQKDLVERAIENYLKDKNIKKRPIEFVEKRGRKI